MSPARLLELHAVKENKKPGIRLIETRPGNPYQYACLSHRWDINVASHQATEENLPDLLQFIDVEQLPANFRDAVYIARELKMPYLWIDSLCIIQEGDPKDKVRELGKMGHIYRNAWLTIAAVSSPGSSGGCFIKDQWPDVSFSISTKAGETHVISARVLDKKGKPRKVAEVSDHYPLLSRAWVFQEYLLSPRLLQCNYGEFTFRCLESSTCECSSNLAPHATDPSRWLGQNNLDDIRRLLASSPGEDDNWSSRRLEALDCWRTIVGLYMRLELTKTSDVLPAAAACAQILSPHVRCDYVAGLWKDTLSTDLLWHVETRREGEKHKHRLRPDESTAPSWSWASVGLRQNIIFVNWSLKSKWLKTEELLQDSIREVHHGPESTENSFGRLRCAYLKVHAKLYPWYLRRPCPPARFKAHPRHRFAWDLHIKRPNSPVTCHGRVEPIAIDSATFELRFDAKLDDEGLEEQDMVGDCKGAPKYHCKLAQVFLLHGVHAKDLKRTLDVFLILKRVLPMDGKPNCYRRVGLFTLLNEHRALPTWDEMIAGRLESRPEEFYLF